MTELRLKVTVDCPLAVPDGVPGPLESIAVADGVRVSQALLLSEGFIYLFTVSVAAGIGVNAATEAVKALVGRLASKNRGTRFTLEEEEITFDDEGRVRRIVKTRIEEDSR